MSSCFGLRKKGSQDDREPLLPQYADNTERQRQLHQKLHTYQMFRALSKGFMPSNEQTIINLRTLLASDALNPNESEISESGRRAVKYSKLWLQQFMDLLQHKNAEDQIQDLIWFTSKSRIEVDVGDIARRVSRTKTKADALAAVESLKTVGSLLLTNSDFRIFLNDLNIIGREVFKESAFKLSDVAHQAGETIEPSAEEQQAVAKPGADAKGKAPTSDDLTKEVAEVSQVIAEGTQEVAKTAIETTAEKLQGDEGQVLLNRLKQSILKLRQRNDYSESVSTLALLIKRYAIVYSRAAEQVATIAEEDTHQNAELDRAMKNAWALVTSFGDRSEWEKTEALLKKVASHKDSNPQFEETMNDIGNTLQRLLTDPNFFEDAPAKLQELREKSEQSSSGQSVKSDAEQLLRQVEVTFRSVLDDQDVRKLIDTSIRVINVFFPKDSVINQDLVRDGIQTFIPLLIAAVQYIPIPRLEVSTPEVDLLLENLVIQPGQTINQTSFLPYRLKIETYNDVEIRKAKFRTTSSMTNLMTIKIDGISARADELGFWLRAHSGIFRLADEGIATVALDEKGVDLHFDVEIGKDNLEHILTLKDVRVHIHKLNYDLRKSKFSWLAWLVKPILRPILRKVIERQVANALTDFFHAANRELLYARERLRATRIANPQDLLTFFKAVAARLQPAEDPDVYTRVGIDAPGRAPIGKPNIFAGVYTPGSLVKVWQEEAVRAGERVEEFDAGGWRNEVFDTHVRSMS